MSQKKQEHGRPRVFVYGTLKPGHANECWLTAAAALSPPRAVSLSGKYEMLDLGAFPGIIDGDETTKVLGYVYTVNDDILNSLDFLESNTKFYTRRKVKLDDGTRAWCYFLPKQYADNYDWMALDKKLNALIWDARDEEYVDFGA